MSRPRFLADHNFNEHVVEGLLSKEPTIDCVLARDVGLDRVRDDQVLAAAAEAGRIVLTHDVNTMKGLAVARIATDQSMPGLFVVQQDAKIG